ncbi:type 1 fimbrial protein [Salmonella enterica]|nr:type 1 fimbrial protein [Salmonella enterica]
MFNYSGTKLVTFMTAGIISGVSSLALATDGTINFTGTISSAACTVSEIAGSSSTTGTVDFGTLSSSTFGTVGAHTVPTPFSIVLSDCAVSSAPTITFSGSPVTASGYTELFKSSISGLGIRLEDADNAGTYYTSGTAAANTGFNTLSSSSKTSATGNFNAYLVDYTGSAAYTGNINTSVTFVINYASS